MRAVGRYHVDDPSKIQGKDDVFATDRSLAALRLRLCLSALCGVSGRVLVLGCGAGRYVRALQRERPDLRIVGGDLSVEALREARRVDAVGNYAALSASDLPFSTRSFAGVVYFDLLEHVPEYQRMIEEIRRVLESGGICHGFVPLEARPGTLYSALRDSRRLPIREWKRDHVGHINFFHGDDVLEAYERAGFTAGDTRYSFHLIGQIHDIIDYWHRERISGGPGVVPVRVVRALARALFIPTWRLSYLEDVIYGGPRLASGLHVTMRKTCESLASASEPVSESPRRPAQL